MLADLTPNWGIEGGCCKVYLYLHRSEIWLPNCSVDNLRFTPHKSLTWPYFLSYKERLFLFPHLPHLECCFIANMMPYLWLSLSPQPHVHIYNESAEGEHIPADAVWLWVSDYEEDVNITALLNSEASRFTSAQNGWGVLRGIPAL